MEVLQTFIDLFKTKMGNNYDMNYIDFNSDLEKLLPFYSICPDKDLDFNSCFKNTIFLSGKRR